MSRGTLVNRLDIGAVRVCRGGRADGNGGCAEGAGLGMAGFLKVWLRRFALMLNSLQIEIDTLRRACRTRGGGCLGRAEPMGCGKSSPGQGGYKSEPFFGSGFG